MSAATSELAEAVVTLGRRVVAAGLVVGAGGNVSARLAGSEILITPSGWRLDELAPDALVTLDLDGSVVAPAGDGSVVGPAGGSSPASKPSSELNMHLAAHRARPDLGVALHVHPPYANLLVATGRRVRLITTDHAYYVRRFAQVPYLPSGTAELGQAVAACLAEVDVVLLAHHGCLVVAPDANLAFERAANLEAAATATWRALLLGDTTTECPPEYLERIVALEARGITYGKHT